MTRLQQRVVDYWLDTIRRAVALGEDDVAYRLTRGLVERCRELGILP